VKIFGENLDSLAIYADKTAKVIQSVQGATSPQIERVVGYRRLMWNMTEQEWPITD
jgi:Cu/Ag efflux pump CusA